MVKVVKVFFQDLNPLKLRLAVCKEFREEGPPHQRLLHNEGSKDKNKLERRLCTGGKSRDCPHRGSWPPGTKTGGQRSHPDKAGEISGLALGFGFLL